MPEFGIGVVGASSDGPITYFDPLFVYAFQVIFEGFEYIGSTGLTMLYKILFCKLISLLLSDCLAKLRVRYYLSICH